MLEKSNSLKKKIIEETFFLADVKIKFPSSPLDTSPPQQNYNKIYQKNGCIICILRSFYIFSPFKKLFLIKTNKNSIYF
jgi:hypothetical protein